MVTDNQLNDKQTIFPINSLPTITQCSANEDWNCHYNHNKALHIQHTLSAVHQHDYKIVHILHKQHEIYMRQDTSKSIHHVRSKT